jgi:O-glycosyl hydrolase
VLFEYNATGSQRLVFQSSYWIIGHLSKFARPGARVIASGGAGTAASAADYDDVRAYSLTQKPSTDFLLSVAFVAADGKSVSTVVANPTNSTADFKLLDSDAAGGARAAHASLPAHSIATFTWSL